MNTGWGQYLHFHFVLHWDNSVHHWHTSDLLYCGRIYIVATYQNLQYGNVPQLHIHSKLHDPFYASLQVWPALWQRLHWVIKSIKPAHKNGSYNFSHPKSATVVRCVWSSSALIWSTTFPPWHEYNLQPNINKCSKFTQDILTCHGKRTQV